MSKGLPLGALKAVEQIKATQALSKTQDSQKADNPFDQVLSERASKDAVRVSAHAQQRLKSANIELKQDDLAAIDQALTTLQAKGARDSLLMGPGYSMVANVKSKTIITAMTDGRMQDKVFTNIDSAMYIDSQQKQ